MYIYTTIIIKGYIGSGTVENMCTRTKFEKKGNHQKTKKMKDFCQMMIQVLYITKLYSTIRQGLQEMNG